MFAQEVVSFNLREEPVIFVGLNHDYVPYSPRDPSSLKGNIANHGVKPDELAETELKIREEVGKPRFCLWPFRLILNDPRVWVKSDILKVGPIWTGKEC